MNAQKIETFFFITLLYFIQSSSAAHFTPNVNKTTLDVDLDSTVRAANCINNSTHCHCAVYPGNGRTCYKPLDVHANTASCYLGYCGSGYHCDCQSSDLCQKLSIVSYSVDNVLAINTSRVDDQTYSFDCTKDNVNLPKWMVGHTSDFKVVAYQEFQLFINNEQIGYGMSNQDDEFTAEIKTNDIIGVVARRQSSSTYGVKVFFKNLEGENRTIDSNWFGSSVFTSNWLEQDFDPEADPNWVRPMLVPTLSADLFFPSSSWYWLEGSEAEVPEVVYMRYQIIGVV